MRYILGGQAQNVADFWATMPPRPGMTAREGWRTWAVPLAIHGDGVAITNVRGVSSKTVDTLCWTSLLSTGATRMTHYLIWFAFGHLVKSAGFAQTWRTFWRKLCESLRALSAGIWPTHTMEGEAEVRSGQQIAGGFWGVVYVQRGDLEFMTKHFALANVASARPCALCRVTNTGVPGELQWTDVNWPPTGQKNVSLTRPEARDMAMITMHHYGLQPEDARNTAKNGEYRKVLVLRQPHRSQESCSVLCICAPKDFLNENPNAHPLFRPDLMSVWWIECVASGLDAHQMPRNGQHIARQCAYVFN